jgi:tRNA(Ile2) C34 agmatinyltransferase TiaS
VTEARVIVRREPLMDKVCPVCGRAFRAVSKQRYDSPPCRRAADYQRHAERRRAHRRETYRRTKQQAEQ